MPLEVDDLSELVAHLNRLDIERNQATGIERVSHRAALNRAVKSFFNLSEAPDADENSRRIFALVKFGNADLLNFFQNVGLESFGVQNQESFRWSDALEGATDDQIRSLSKLLRVGEMSFEDAPVSAAMRVGNSAAMRIFFEEGDQSYKYSALCELAEINRKRSPFSQGQVRINDEQLVDMADVLLDMGANPGIIALYDGKNIFHHIALGGEPELAKRVISYFYQNGEERVLRLLINEEFIDSDADLLTPMGISLKQQDTKLMNIFFEARAKIKNQQVFSSPQRAIFLQNPDELLSKIITDDAERSEFLKINEAKFILGLAYSSNSLITARGKKYESDSVFYGLIKRKISELEFEGKEQFLDVVNRSSSIDGVEISGGKIDVLDACYKRHDARFILERDDQNNPLRLSYCDGNLPIGQDDSGQKYGEIIFEIDREKWDVFKSVHSKLSEDGLADCFAREFSSFRDSGHLDRKKFSQTLSNFVVCDELGKPKVVGRNIPTKAQNRGNCTFKSFNIVTRAILSKVNPEMVFEKDEQGNGCGAGYEVYQGYKKALIAKNLDCLLEFAHPKNQENPNYEDVVNFLKNNVFLQAVKKGDLDLMTKLEEIFIQNKIDLTEIKNYKGKDAMFVAGESKKAETINWLVERYKKSKKYSRVGYLDIGGFGTQEEETIERPSGKTSSTSQVQMQPDGLGSLTQIRR